MIIQGIIFAAPELVFRYCNINLFLRYHFLIHKQNNFIYPWRQQLDLTCHIRRLNVTHVSDSNGFPIHSPKIKIFAKGQLTLITFMDN